MRSRHRQTLARVYVRPTPADIRWAEIEAMLLACGVAVTQRAGSRVVLAKNHERVVVHRPHPRPQTSRATVRDIAAFLRAAGVRLDDEE